MSCSTSGNLAATCCAASAMCEGVQTLGGASTRYLRVCVCVRRLLGVWLLGLGGLGGLGGEGWGEAGGTGA